jgi:hypothetical protein
MAMTPKIMVFCIEAPIDVFESFVNAIEPFVDPLLKLVQPSVGPALSHDDVHVASLQR